MTNEEFSKLISQTKFPRTFEGRDRIYLERTGSPYLLSEYPDLRRKIPLAPIGVGSISSYEPTPRERLVDFLTRNLGGDENTRRDRAEFLSKIIDVTPAAIPLAASDTTRAISEGRYKGAILPGITAVAPFFGKPARMLTGMKRVGQIDDAVEAAGPLETNPIETPSSPSASVVPEYRTKTPLYYTKMGNGHNGGPHNEPLTQPSELVIRQPTTGIPFYIPKIGTSVDRPKPDNIDFKVPAMPWERSSPWVAPYPPIPRPQRDFSLDYPKEVLFDEAGNLRKDVVDKAGNLLKDIKGRPLTAKYIVGRRKLGEKDQGLSQDDIYSILGRDFDADVMPVPKSGLIPGTIGNAYMSNPPVVKFWGDLPQDQTNTTLAHEMGHIIDEVVEQIKMEGAEDEFDMLYSELNTGRSGPPLYLPEHRNYSPLAWAREKAAEAIRAYSTDPNMVKTVAPKVAGILQDLNDHPVLSKIIQFNGIPLGALIGTGVAMTGKSEKSQAASLPSGRPPSSVDADTIKSKNGMRRIAAALLKVAPIAPVPNALAPIAVGLLNRRVPSPVSR